ncbi:MAG: adenylyl-sulfate kinase, partial [Planctomycetota bacterium]|nr:adenylyl-sulfate kinase [Planctomycetota bacterium]
SRTQGFNRRSSRMSQGFVLWFTGLSGSGKSTVSEAVVPQLRERGVRIEVLDGDVVRTNLSKGLGFSKEDRDTNILRVGFVANLLARNGLAACCACISPYRKIRDTVRGWVEGDGGQFVEIFMDTPLDTCIDRDPKGLYQKALAGEIKQFTGIDDPYEAPENPEIRLQTTETTPEECACQILECLEARDLIPSA